MSNKEWDLISYNQSAEMLADQSELASAFLKLLDENPKLKISLGEATLRIIEQERKIIELKSR
mgnify:FL=1